MLSSIRDRAMTMRDCMCEMFNPDLSPFKPQSLIYENKVTKDNERNTTLHLFLEMMFMELKFD